MPALQTLKTNATTKLTLLLHEESGNSALEYALVVALVALGATTLGSVSSMVTGLVQYGVDKVTAMWPA
ncbi:MAG TPA: hypothetical protein VGD62_10085 [Acidobacteriaceae bacterium]